MADTVWVVEGDDHEVEVVEADSAAQALTNAHAAFIDRYGRYNRDLMSVVGNFDGDIEDVDSLQFRPTPGAQDEARARNALASW